MTLKVNSAELARAAFNALAFMPARSKFKQARVIMSPAGIQFTATDGYAAGQDYVTPAEDPYGFPAVTAYVNAEALKQLDQAGRADKTSKERLGVGTFTVSPGDGLMFVASDGAQCPCMIETQQDDIWSALDEIFAYHENREPYLPDVIAFDPQILSRFAKVKTDKDGRVMDLKLSGDRLEPVLVKLGVTFRGIIMPIDRTVNATNIGEEGLW